jgi:hypothetical protein
VNFRGETAYSEDKLPPEAARKACERRRRIEDIREAARLEREVIEEVWELNE